jgi:hypothetical protein
MKEWPKRVVVRLIWKRVNFNNHLILPYRVHFVPASRDGLTFNNRIRQYML